MSRKSLFYIGLFLIVASVLLAIYIKTRPDDIPVIDHTTTSNNLDYREVNSYVYNEDKPVALFFHSSDDIDSILVISNMLDKIKAERGIEKFETLYYVDLKNIDPDQVESYIVNNWGFLRFPTFVVISIEDSKVKTSSILQWDPARPYTIDDVRQWITDNQIQ